ncbi:serine hydrolase [Streptomyces jumonjinensis]|uniref:Serine hydrolase n=1 Tax=Streptomyces jumonjinensis TaxID=1945 RepID=A0A646KDT1_STRJU|nr:serine hydrolase [Streptomyces jumonjinensis]MQT00442.1 serine hydrolase [Streptomyces jumonjinensis]
MSLSRVVAAARRSSALPLTLAVAAVDVDSGETVGVDDGRPLPVASASKLLLLAEVARRLDAGELGPEQPVAVLDEDRAGGTGLLFRLSGRVWTVTDLCWLTASVSDNTATNALLRLVGRESTARLAERLGVGGLALHDRVRDARGPDVPPVFATGTARDLARLVAHTVRGTMASPGASALLLGWMRANTDHGLVPALVAHDPYAPGFPAPPPPGELLVANKTGTDPGVRADAGVVVGARRLAYAVVAHWDTALGSSTERAAVHAVRDVGRTLAECALRRPAG